jgi:alpha/beta superfamily hydrolase
VVGGPAGNIEVDIHDPGGEHFFHGRLHLLQRIITERCS